VNNIRTAREMLDHMSEFAAKLFHDTGAVHPMWILENDNEVLPIVAPFDGPDTKDAAAKFVRSKAKEMKAQVSGFMAEAWVVELKKDQPSPKSISKHEDRREIIQIFAEDTSGAHVMGAYYILRPEHGKAKLSPFKVYPEADHISGRFTSILERT